MTFIPASAEAVDLVAYHVGPGTVILDALARKLLGQPLDADGKAASGGAICGAFLNELLADPYYQRPAPKIATGSEWGDAYVQRLAMAAENHQCRDPKDILATVTEMIAKAAARAVLAMTERPHQVILCGGGALNIHLASRIRMLLSPCSTVSCEKFAVGVRCKGALCWAMLAAARMDKTPIYCPGATGMQRPAVLGALYQP